MADATGATTTTLAPEAGSRTDRIELLQQLSGGTIGAVHKARNPKLNRTVALRQVQVPEWLDDADELIKRFLAEARAASALDHRNIARLYTGGYKGFTVFLTSEFVDGVNVKEHAVNRNLGMPDLMSLAKQLCAAFDCAHQKNVIHQALTPANVKVLPDGTLKVLDFGLLREKQLYSPTPAKRLESEHYLSPEQLKNRAVTAASNIFSAGTILYELFTTRNPFAGKHLGEVDKNITDVDPTPATQAHARVPEAVSRVLAKALAKNAAARYSSFAEFSAALDEAWTAAPGKAGAAATSKPATGKFTALAAPAPKPAPAPAAANGKPASPASPIVASNGAKEQPRNGAAAGIEEKPQPKPPAPPKPPVATARLQAAVVPPSKTPAKILKQWKLIGGIIAGLFVVSALAISLNHRSKISPAPPESGHPQAETQPQSTTPDITSAQQAVEVREIEPRASRPRASKAESASVAAPAVDGQLAVFSEPDGAIIAIDGKTTDGWKTPQTLASLAPAVYKVTLSKPGYATETRSIEVLSGNRASLNVKLTAVKGSLNVGGTPSGARILIDGKETGKFTPAEFSLDPATHTINLQKEGYFDSTGEIKIVAGQTVSYSPALTVAGRTDNIKVVGGFKKLFGGGSSEGMSRIEFRTDPKGVQVTINGNTLPKSTPFEIQVEPGNYEITLQKDGYKPIHKSVTTQVGQKLKIDEQLNK